MVPEAALLTKPGLWFMMILQLGRFAEIFEIVDMVPGSPREVKNPIRSRRITIRRKDGDASRLLWAFDYASALVSGPPGTISTVYSLFLCVLRVSAVQDLKA